MECKIRRKKKPRRRKQEKKEKKRNPFNKISQVKGNMKQIKRSLKQRSIEKYNLCIVKI